MHQMFAFFIHNLPVFRFYTEEDKKCMKTFSPISLNVQAVENFFKWIYSKEPLSRAEREKNKKIFNQTKFGVTKWR